VRLRLTSILPLLACIACDGLLEVDDPTRIEEADARSAEFAEQWARGSTKMVSEGWDHMLALLSLASDEIRADEGTSVTGWEDIDRGIIGSPGNNSLQSHFPLIAVGFGMAEQTVEVLDSILGAGTLADSSTNARAHLLASVMKATSVAATLPGTLYPIAQSEIDVNCYLNGSCG
jgi:hypothetical protein